ncbi:MAG: ABC transporter substrate-binding protein, partial [Gammaproteobacteria bacterium]
MLESSTFCVDRRGILKAGAAAAAASALPFASAFAKSEKPVRIGLLESLTGTYADVGLSDVQGAKLAVEEINAKGGILGRPVKLLVEDYGTSPSLGVQKARKLIEVEKVDFLAGTSDSAVALAVSQTALQLKTVFMCTAAHTDAVTGSRCNWCTFRTCTTTWMLSAGNSRILFDKFGKGWYFVTPDYAFGHTEQKDYAAQLKSYGGQVLGNSLFPVGTTDFSSYLVKASLAHPNVLMVLGIGEDKINCLKQAT